MVIEILKSNGSEWFAIIFENIPLNEIYGMGVPFQNQVSRFTFGIQVAIIFTEIDFAFRAENSSEA